MDLREITEKEKTLYDKTVTHIVQSWQWGEFRKSLGTKLVRYGLYENGKLKIAFHLSFHKIPLTKSFVGYLAKGPAPDKNLGEALQKIGKAQNCAFIKIEPNIEIANDQRSKPYNPRFIKSPKPHFTKYSYILDLTQTEEQILKNMHPKFRYNIKVAEKHNVKVEERTDDKGFKIYLKLFFETCKRQNYFAHDENYHQKIWNILKEIDQAKVLIASYQSPSSKLSLPLNAWMIYNFHDTLYYPYGGSSAEYKNLMATNLTCWQAIKLGKKMGLKYFDLWGAAAPNAKATDPYQGFTRFKASTGAKLIEYLDTYDLVFNPLIFWLFTFVDSLLPLKVALLKIIRKI